MATIVDSLVVELGLDASKFTLQQREAFETAKRLEDQQVKAAKNVEYSAGKAGDALGVVRTQALSMLAVLTGGAGVVAFATQINSADAAVGRLGRNLGQSVSTISKWQGVARIFGGDAQAMAQSFTQISDAFAGWKIGMVSPLIADLRAISTAGGKVIDVNKGVEQSYLDLAENLRAINARDPAQAGLLGRKIGLDPALFDAMISGNLPRVLEMVKQLHGATNDSADAAGRLEQNWNKMRLSAEGLGRVLLEKAQPALSKFFNDFAEIFEGFSKGKVLKGSLADKIATIYNPNYGGGYTPSDRIDSSLATGGGAFASQTEKEQFIRSEAAKRGINPNVAMEVARREGFNNFVSTIPGETSYGAYQLHVTPGGRGGHLGDQFKSKTGLDPSDPRNERAGIQFALDDVTRNGWTAFHGAKNNGIGKWAGIDRNAGSSSTTTTEININGPITVQPPAGANADKFATDFAAALKRQGETFLANNGAQ
jgi:hypothetical protein